MSATAQATLEALSPARQRTRHKLVSAARELAANGGYSAVTMHALAERAGVSRITAYKYFSNKDHVLAAVIVDWSRDIVARLDRDSGSGREPGRKEPAPMPSVQWEPARLVAERFERIFDEVLAQPRLLSAVLASSASSAPGAVAASSELLDVMRGYFGPAMRRLEPNTAERMVRFAGYLFQAILLAVVSGRIDRDRAVADFRAALGALLEAPGDARHATPAGESSA